MMTEFAETVFELKVGDSFVYGFSISLPPGNWIAKSDLIKKETREKVYEFAVQIGTPVGDLTPIVIEAPATSTKLWKAGKRLFDIKFEDQTGSVLSSKTYQLNVVNEVTRKL